MAKQTLNRTKFNVLYCILSGLIRSENIFIFCFQFDSITVHLQYLLFIIKNIRNKGKKLLISNHRAVDFNAFFPICDQLILPSLHRSNKEI